MTLDLAHLRKLASEATPGPWATWAGKGWPEAASIVMPPEMCIGVWWPLRAPNETQHDKPLAWFRDPQDQAFAAVAAESLLPLVDEVERLRKQLGDALETVDLLREERAQRPTLKSFNELTEQLQSVREDVTRVQVATLRADNDELRSAVAELLDALPKCDTKGCDAQAVYLDEDGPVYCGDHASVVDPGDELELADPAARLRALLGKAGA